jgi:hypothetical protein
MLPQATTGTVVLKEKEIRGHTFLGEKIGLDRSKGFFRGLQMSKL